MIATVVRRPLSPPSIRVIVAAGAAVVALATFAAVEKGSPKLLLGACALLAAVGVGYLAVWLSPAAWVSLAVIGSTLSGNARQVGLPLSPDRLFMTAAIAALVLRLPNVHTDRRIVWRPTHVFIGIVAGYAIVNAYAAGTLLTSKGFFTILDRLGIVPMLVFVLAPFLFGTRRSRDVLLTALVLLGAYLAVTAFGEGLGITALVWPKYILDPSVGIHFGRARGPFVESVADGLALYGCAVACAVAAMTWTTRWKRQAAVVVLVGCMIGTAFTLTRAVWLATAAATVIAMLLSPQTRRYLVPLLVIGGIGLVAVFVLVPGFATKTQSRTSDVSPVWERYATDAGAIRAVEAHPLFGLGWDTWQQKNTDYLRQGKNYPLTRTVGVIDIHNVFLSHAAELGIVGVTLWTLALGGAVAGAVLRPGPAELDPWRLGMVALLINFVITGAFGPLSYALPNLLLWLWAGVAGLGHFSNPVPEAVAA